MRRCCACGCGARVKPGNHFLAGHCRRASPSLEERAAISERIRRSWEDPERRASRIAKISATRKRLFAAGYVNPLKGRKRPDLSERNRRDNPVKYASREAMIARGVRVYQFQKRLGRIISKPQRRLYAIVVGLVPDAKMEHKVKTASSVRFVDVAVPHLRLALEYDEPFWHQDKDADSKRDSELAEQGWTVVRFSRGFRDEEVIAALVQKGEPSGE